MPKIPNQLQLKYKTIYRMIAIVENEIAITESNTVRMDFLIKRLSHLKTKLTQNPKKKIKYKEPDYGN